MSWLDPGAGMLGAFLQGTPKMPDFHRIDPQSEQQKAIAGNIAVLPQLEQLGSQITGFGLDQITRMMETAVPMYNQLRGQASKDISSELSGQLPADVQAQIQDMGAARAISGGYAGSGVHSNLVARDLGLTSLQLTQQGLSSAESWMGTMNQIYNKGVFDVTSMFLTPEQQIQTDVEERDKQFQHDWAQNILKWQGSAGYIIGGEIQKDSEEFAQMVSDVASSAAGSLGGAAMCWVAREVFGRNNPKWILFRHWMLTEAPTVLRVLYIKYGRQLAAFIKDKPVIKRRIRNWMEARIASSRLAGCCVIDGKILSY